MTQTFVDDVRAGLRSEPKILPCKYFYDARGSELFERICELDEYYVTRADFEATRDHISEMVAAILPPGSPATRLVELGSGSSSKTRVLLDHLPAIHSYVPIEISEAALDESVAGLRAAYPALTVVPLSADYTEPVELPASDARRTVVYFPGSTIGNFHHRDAIRFLRRLHALISPGGGLLIGVDAKKDIATLERAYDDAAGVTAAFNLNLLVRINAELGADFDLDAFKHRARYDENFGRIEMHLVSMRRQTVTIADERFDFDADETVRTEVSYKYSRDDFRRIASEANLRIDDSWQDTRQLFNLFWLTPT